ncbi:hypothetical protein B5F41_01535 [Gordonibacter sp. An232A]|nr:hypothetical protein B5F41_01310 [Gordonibacter sp. An232A]OUO96676.1 hypothetical protein B5F41_01535 [Gordonibacter sp. An232A]
MSSENERKRKGASQPSRLHGVLRGGMAFTLASTLMLPTTALADEPSIGSGTPRSEQNVVDELLKAEQAQTASTDATSDGVAEAAGEAFCAASEADAEAPDPNALIGSVAAGETDENSAGGGVLLTDPIADVDAEGNVTIIVQLEEGGSQGTTLLSSIFGTAKQDRHTYFKDKVRELATEADENGATLFSVADDPVQELHDYYHVIDGFAIKAPAAILNDIKALDGVKNAFIETQYSIPETQDSEGGVANEDALVMTGANEVEQTGEGQLVAIIDSGLDTDHEAFSGDLNDEAVALTEAEANDVISEVGVGAYVSEKIPFAYDYVDGDNDVNPSATAGEHGTHVAGIAAANGGEIRGTAPDAQIAFMKIAADSNGSLPDSAIIAALDDVMALGVDAVNMSFGLDASFAEGGASDTYADAFATLEAAGVTLNAAAGNAYSSALGNQSGSNLPYATDPDSSMISSPAAMGDAFAVASADVSAKRAYIASSDGTQIPYYELQSNSGATVQSFKDKVANGEYSVVDGGYGTEADAASLATKYPDQDWSKTFVLVKRGTSDGSELKLGQKVSNIWSFQSSVAAVIIYNNEPGDLSNGASDVNLWVPALTISQEAGEALLAQENPTVTVDHSKLMEASKDYNSSDFSSWGVTPDLKLKPEIMAPGGNVYSSVLDGQYAYMSGTSMATPQMTGIAAQVRQYVDEDAKFSALSDAEKGDIVTQLLMSTAKPVADGDSYVSPRHQGAGIANVPAATSTEVYATVEGAEEASRPKADLGDSANGQWSFTVTLHNTGATEHSYTLDTAALSEKVADGLMQQSSENWTGKGISVSYSGLSGDTVTVPANGTASVTVSITCEDVFKTWASANTPNGTFVDGFALFKAVEGDEGGVDLSVPFMGFYGDWGAVPVFDGSLVPEEPTDEEGSTNFAGDYHIYGTVEADANGYALGLNTLSTDAMDRFMMGDYSVVDRDKMVVSNKGFSTSPNQLTPLTGMLRNADNMKWTYKNAAGETVLEYSSDAVRKSYYYQSQGTVTWAEAFMNVQPVFQGVDQSGKQLPDGTYTLTRTATIAGTQDTQEETVSFYYDTTAPEISNIEYAGEGDERVMSFDVKDESFLGSVQFNDPAGSGYFLRVNPESDPEVGEDGMRTYHFEVKIADIKQAWDDVNAQVGGQLGDIPNTVSLYAWDYGQNGSAAASAVVTPVDATGITLSAEEVSLAPGQVGSISATVVPEDATDKTVTWASSDENVVKVDEDGTLTGVGVGAATITAASVSNPEIAATATVTVANVSADTGIIMSQENVSVAPNETLEIAAIVAPEYEGCTIEWTSSDESIATVAASEDDAAKAVISAGDNIGDVTVKATLTTESGKRHFAETNVQVRPANYDEFEIDDEGVLLYYKGNSTYVDIPNNVVEIGAEAFQATPVQTVVVPKSVKKIGDYAFRQAQALKSVIFEGIDDGTAQLEEIGREVFADTSDTFTEIAFPQSLKKMGEACFASTYIEKVDFGGLTEIPTNAVNYCSRFSTVTMSDQVTSIGDGAFGNTGIGEINLTNVEGRADAKGWPSGLESVGNGAFTGTWISDGNFPETLTHIGDSAFWGTKITDVDLSHVQHVGSSAFAGTGISELTISDSVTSVGSGAFSQMPSLTKVHIGKNVPANAFAALFRYSTGITEFTCDPEANCSVKDGVLFSKDGKTLITYTNGVAGHYDIPAGTEVIDFAAFEGGSVSSLSFPEGLTTVSDNAFTGCVQLKGEIILPSTMETIGGYGFSNNPQITFVDLGGTKSIGGSSFYSCAALTDIDFGDRLESIGAQAFGLGVPLFEVILPDTVTSIGDSAFTNNNALVKVHIGAGLQSGFDSIFTGCNNLAEITVSENNPVYSAQDNVLYGNVTYEEGATDYYGKPLYSGKHLLLALPTIEATELEIADGTEYIDNQAVRNLANLERVVLPESIKGLYTGAFNGCNALKEVVFEGEGPVFVYSNAFPAGNVEVIDFGNRIETIDGAFMMGAPKHLVIRGGNNGTFSDGLNIGNAAETVYIGSGMTTVGLSSWTAPKILVVGADVSSLSLPRVSSPSDITVYAIPGTTGYETAKQALASIGIADSYLKDYTELGVELTSDVATTPGATATVTAEVVGGVEGEKSFRFIQTNVDGSEAVLQDWSATNACAWTVPADGSVLRVEVRDATWLTAGTTLGSVEVPVITGDLPTEAITSIDGGETLTVGAQASDGAALTYQWYMDDVAIEGATDVSFTPVELGEHTYHCVVTATKDGASATATTSTATVTVYAAATAPVISSSLVSTVVEQGSTVTLSVDASTEDGGTLTYQWYKDGVAIEGATTSVYTPDTSEVGEHTYYVVITNTVGTAENAASVASGEATVTVTEASTPDPGPDPDPEPEPEPTPDPDEPVDPDEPTDPTDTDNPDDGTDEPGDTTGGSDNDGKGNGATGGNGNAADNGNNAAGGQNVMSKTGDVAPVAAVGAAGALSALIAAVAAFLRRRNA